MCDDCCECSPAGTCGTVWHNFNVAATWFVLATPLISACPLGIGYALVTLGEVVYLCFGVLMCSVEPRDGSVTATAIWLREVTPFGWSCAERHTAWRCVPTFWFPFSFWSELVVDVGTIILAYEELRSGCADWAVVIVTVFTALVKSIIFLVSVWASCMPSTRNGGFPHGPADCVHFKGSADCLIRVDNDNDNERRKLRAEHAATAPVANKAYVLLCEPPWTPRALLPLPRATPLHI
eukprot:m.224184 g.224184  ORF g.224184 m.224184 type:complete len:237 (+) comp25872_c0_seq1:369-1079(+)